MARTLYVDPEDVLLELGVLPVEATDVQKAKVATRIGRAQDKVGLFLGRPGLATVERTLVGMWRDATYPETSVQAWPGACEVLDDRCRVKSYVANTDDPEVYDVTFVVGLDLTTTGDGTLHDPQVQPILDFITMDAIEQLVGDPQFPDAARIIQSVSNNGQSISYAKAADSPDAAGGKLTIGTLSGFKRLNVGQPSPQSSAPWPYGARNYL